MNSDLAIPQNYIVESFGWFSMEDSIVISENITPSTYLSFAVQDFERSEEDRSNVNAFSNAKRAIHFQTDIISKAFGIKKLPQNKEITSPRNLNSVRNAGLLEEESLTN